MKLADLFTMIVGPDVDIGFSAYDGSRAGNPASDVRIELRSPRALSYLAQAPGQLGVARANVMGDLDVEGDLYELFLRLGHVSTTHLTRSDYVTIGRELAPALTKRAPAPPEEIRLGGRLHSLRRDASAISHHYDVSNRFYRWVLGPSMAYTCAVYPTLDATLDEAQEEKFDLVCRKLGLEPGMRLLDVGCGWGGMVLHAVKNYGVSAIGVTLSEQQASWGQQAIADAGLEGVAQIRHADYRSVSESGFDRVSSIGLTEHIGKANYDDYFAFLRSKLRDGGRLLNHSITRTSTTQATRTSRGFINRYIFPDGELVHVGHLIDRMEHQQLEVRHEENLREHYAMTLRDWVRNLEDHWDEAVEEVGWRKARVWRLYLVASRWGFETNRIQLHQVLATRTPTSTTSTGPDALAAGDADVPLRPWF